MEVTISNGQSQPAVTEQNPSPANQVAPVQQQERFSGVTPGASSFRVLSQPAGTGQQGAAQGQQPQPTTPQGDPRISQAEAARIAAERERDQLRGVLGQVQQYATQQQQTQAMQREIRTILAAAENMPTNEANTYLANQIEALQQRTVGTLSQQIAQLQQNFEQEKRAIAAPMYADHLIESIGLPPEAKEELLAIGDPEAMYRQAPVIKKRYDAWQQQLGSLQQGQQQLARAAEVQNLRESGIAQVGGQGASGVWQFEVSDDPDERAMQLLDIQDMVYGGQQRQ